MAPCARRGTISLQRLAHNVRASHRVSGCFPSSLIERRCFGAFATPVSRGGSYGLRLDTTIPTYVCLSWLTQPFRDSPPIPVFNPFSKLITVYNVSSSSKWPSNRPVVILLGQRECPRSLGSDFAVTLVNDLRVATEFVPLLRPVGHARGHSRPSSIKEAP